jgi:hypothetical protein
MYSYKATSYEFNCPTHAIKMYSYKAMSYEFNCPTHAIKMYSYKAMRYEFNCPSTLRCTHTRLWVTHLYSMDGTIKLVTHSLVRVHLSMDGTIKFVILVVISTYYTNKCKNNYHIIMTWWPLIFPMIIDIEMKCYTCINCLLGHFQPYFIHIVAVIFIGIGNQYTQENYGPVTSQQVCSFLVWLVTGL